MHDVLADDRWRLGHARFARGDAWDAHEAWEDLWRAATPGQDDPERALLAALIQLAAAVVQARRGRARGVATLVARARANLARVGAPRGGVDPARLDAALARWARDPKDPAPLPLSC